MRLILLVVSCFCFVIYFSSLLSTVLMLKSWLEWFLLLAGEGHVRCSCAHHSQRDKRSLHQHTVSAGEGQGLWKWEWHHVRKKKNTDLFCVVLKLVLWIMIVSFCTQNHCRIVYRLYFCWFCTWKERWARFAI